MIGIEQERLCRVTILQGSKGVEYYYTLYDKLRRVTILQGSKGLLNL